MLVNPNLWRSWNGNILHKVDKVFVPTQESELCSAVAESPGVRIAGRGYSSGDIVGGTENLISLEKYNGVVSRSPETGEITVQAGMILRHLILAAAEMGLGFPSLPDIDDVTVGGAIATGTHGTGRQAHPLSGYLVKARVVSPQGKVREYTPEDKEFPALQVSLGLLGIFSTLTFRLSPLKPLFLVERPVKDKEWIEKFPTWVEKHEFVRVLFLPHSNRGYVILGDNQWSPELSTFAGWKPQESYRAVPAPKRYQYRRRMSAWLYGFTGKWPILTVMANRILARLFFSASQVHTGNLYEATVTKSRSGTMELAEWSIPLSRFQVCFSELRQELNRLSNPAFAHIPMDVRFLRGDDTWLGNASGQDTVTVGCVTRHAATADTYAAFEAIERIFISHGGRPHWAKRFASGEKVLRSLYPRWEDFVKLRREMDPQGKFLSPHLRSLFE